MTAQDKATKTKSLRYNWVTQYLDSYFTVIPLNGKTPIVQSWQKSKGITDPKALGDNNYGVVIPNDVVVIDIDPRNFPKDAQGDVIKPTPLARLNEVVGEDVRKLDTLVIRTGSGGYHIYLNKKPDQLTKENLPQFKGIEFKTKGRQVVGPYSVHPTTGKLYKPKNGSPDMIMEAPGTLIRLISRSAYDNFGATKFSGEATDADVERFIAYLEAEEPAVEGDNGDQHTYVVACQGRDFGLNEDQVLRCMLSHWNDRCSPPWQHEELMGKVRNAYAYAAGGQGSRSHDAVAAQFQDLTEFAEKEQRENGVPEIAWQFNQTGGLKKTFTNTVNFLLLEPYDEAFRYNIFTDNIEVCTRLPWDHNYVSGARTFTDADAKYIRFDLSRRMSYNTSDLDIFDAALVVAKHRTYHPIRDFLRSLKWDGVKRLDTWLTVYAGVRDSAYTRAVGRKVLVAGVARVMQPGCKFDYVLVLEGPQGVGKSMLVQALGLEWASDLTIDPANKDVIAYMEGQWVIEMSEMVAHRKSDADSLKAFLTRTIDKVRKPYARVPVSIHRQSIFIGTINPQAGVGYLKDPTGNRRFWPVEVGEVRIDALRQDVEQLWAEAYFAYKKGELLYLTGDLDRAASNEQMMRVSKDSFEDFIVDYVENVMLEDDQVFTAEHVMQFALNIPKGQVKDHERARVMAILNKRYKLDTYYDSKTNKSQYGFMKSKRRQ